MDRCKHENPIVRRGLYRVGASVSTSRCGLIQLDAADSSLLRCSPSASLCSYRRSLASYSSPFIAAKWVVSYARFQSIGRISSPNACNFSSASLAYIRTLLASSASEFVRLLRQRRACKMFAAPITKFLSIPAEAREPDASHTGLPSGATAEPAEDAQSTIVI